MTRQSSKKSKPQTKNVTNISFSEFMAWLSGVEDMQPKDWAPNVEQWNRIREKLNTVSIEVIDNVQSTRVLPPAPGLLPTHNPGFLPSNIQPAVYQQPTPIVSDLQPNQTVVDSGAYVSDFAR